MDGRAVAVPSQDMILGSYYLTMDKAGEPGEGRAFRDFNEAMMAYANGALGLHAPIKIRVTKEIDGVKKTKLINATLGRLIFNAPIPQDLGMFKRTTEDDLFELERTVGGASHGLTSSAVVDQRVNCFLKHTLLVTDNDFGSVNFNDLLQTVVSADDSSVKLVQVGRRETSAVQLNHRTNVRGNDGNYI